MKEKVYEYQREVSEKVKSFSRSLQLKKDGLQKASTKVTNIAEGGNVCEQIKRKQAVTREVNNKMSVEVDQFKLTVQPALVVQGKYICSYKMGNVIKV